MLDVTRNNLDRETSPYLLQHKDNPVHWQPWGAEALEAARLHNKPILLSIGYAACHWCHVMAHESFEDPETAAVMNELYINIKVDREERPDIDTIYMSALHMLGEQGGWPLTMFLSPDGEPFWGGTYFPPTSRYGRPGFRDVLSRIAAAYRDDPGGIAKNIGLIREGLQRMSEPSDIAANDRVVTLSHAGLDRIAESILGAIDMQHGGLNGAPKFPHTGVFELLWRSYLRTGSPKCRHAVEVTLDQMCQGGIYDHLGGGFARYSTDPDWHVPHFEKMLYDNAQMLDLLCLVWQRTRSPLYEARIRETVAWVLREMVSPGGGFAATLDADSEGVEGKFYVWTAGEVVAALGADALAFMPAYDVTEHGNWEETNILRRTLHPELGDADFEARLARCRAKLLELRDKRVRPGWDDKVLADWNGLMIAALAKCGAALNEPSWIAAAASAFAFVRDHMSQGGRLMHSWRMMEGGGKLRHTGLLDDYANMTQAALSLYDVTGDAHYLDQAADWVGVLDAHYWDDTNQGYFLTADDAEALIVRTRTIHDNATPSGNGVMIGVLARLWLLTGNDAYRERADGLISAFSADVGRATLAVPGLLNGFDLLAGATQIVIVGERQQAETIAMLREVFAVSLPNRVLMVAPPGTSLPPHHPAHGKTKQAKAGEVQAFICRGATCSLPIRDPAALRAELGRSAA